MLVALPLLLRCVLCSMRICNLKPFNRMFETMPKPSQNSDVWTFNSKIVFPIYRPYEILLTCTHKSLEVDFFWYIYNLKTVPLNFFPLPLFEIFWCTVVTQFRSEIFCVHENIPSREREREEIWNTKCQHEGSLWLPFNDQT